MTHNFTLRCLIEIEKRKDTVFKKNLGPDHMLAGGRNLHKADSNTECQNFE